MRRVSVMDRFNLPDLTEFIGTISLVVRGCETAALKDKGYPPSTLTDGPVLTLPPKERKELYDKVIISILCFLLIDYSWFFSSYQLLTPCISISRYSFLLCWKWITILRLLSKSFFMFAGKIFLVLNGFWILSWERCRRVG